MAKAQTQPLVIGGVAMPPLKAEGLTITKEKVWSSNTGRAADGNMIGDLVTIKYKLQCEWPPLSRNIFRIYLQGLGIIF